MTEGWTAGMTEGWTAGMTEGWAAGMTEKRLKHAWNDKVACYENRFFVVAKRFSCSTGKHFLS